MTLAEFRGIRKKEEWPGGAAPEEPALAHSAGGGAPAREQAHPGPRQYVRVAAVMAVVEVLELVVFYVGALGRSALAFLIALTVIQFAFIAMWYMHLKFDSRLFSTLLVGGIVLAVALFIIVLMAFRVYFFV